MMQRSFRENESFYTIFSNSLSQVDVHMAEIYAKNQAVG